ncbi:hypothetical protein DZA35_00135 [Arcobacter sp. HD9-500m-PIT-SAG03]|nr:hypothetical protein DZA35_00135 [Arcobacter sp. HD9-500m-PIT-SAG03]
MIAIVHYEKSVHLQEAYKTSHSLPATEKIINEILSLPIYPELKESDIELIVKLLQTFDNKEIVC